VISVIFCSSHLPSIVSADNFKKAQNKPTWHRPRCKTLLLRCLQTTRHQ